MDIAASDPVRWTDVLQAMGQAAGAVGTLAALIFLALQVRSQSAALKDQRESSAKSLEAVADQIRYQVDEAREVAEQTRLQTEQTNLLAEQLRLVAATNRSLLYQNLTREMQEISRIFLQYPRLRKYFYDNVPVPADREKHAEVCIMAEIFVDFIASAMNTNSLFDNDQRRVWTQYFQYVAEHSPAIRQYWQENREWYEPPVKAVLDPVVADPGDRAP